MLYACITGQRPRRGTSLCWNIGYIWHYLLTYNMIVNDGVDVRMKYNG